MAASSVRFGPGVTREVGMDLVDLGVRRALVVTDPNLARLAPVGTVLAALDAAGVESVLYDRVRVEPTDLSFRDAIRFAEAATVDGFVAVGGGSVIDTAKAVNLYSTYPPQDFLDYVNAPIGKAMPVPGPLKPLDCRSDNRRDRKRDHRRQHLRSHNPEGQDRHRQPPAQTNARHAGSRKHPDDAAAGRGVQRSRHPEPCARVVYGDTVFVTRTPDASRGSSGLPGIESNQRHLGPAGSAHRRASTSFVRSKIRPTTKPANR